MRQGQIRKPNNCAPSTGIAPWPQRSLMTRIYVPCYPASPSQPPFVSFINISYFHATSISLPFIALMPDPFSRIQDFSPMLISTTGLQWNGSTAEFTLVKKNRSPTIPTQHMLSQCFGEDNVRDAIRFMVGIVRAICATLWYVSAGFTYCRDGCWETNVLRMYRLRIQRLMCQVPIGSFSLFLLTWACI